MILFYNTDKHLELPKVKPNSISVQSYAQCSKILNIEPRYIRERLRDVYIIDNDYMTYLLSLSPFPLSVIGSVIIWDNQFVVHTDTIDWEILNIIVALSGSYDKERSYEDITNNNMSIKQDIMYLSVQLHSVSAKIAEFRKRQNYRYFDTKLFAKILKRRKIKCNIIAKNILLTFKNVKIGSTYEGYVIYNNIYVYISEWNSIDRFILEFNNFQYSSAWNIQDVLLHPYLQVPYYINIPYLGLSYEAYIDHIIKMVTGIDYKPGTGLIDVTNIMTSYNRYRRIWNGLKDPRKTDDVNSYDIFKR